MGVCRRLEVAHGERLDDLSVVDDFRIPCAPAEIILAGRQLQCAGHVVHGVVAVDLIRRGARTACAGQHQRAGHHSRCHRGTVVADDGIRLIHRDALVAFVRPAFRIVGVRRDIARRTADDARRHVERQHIDITLLRNGQFRTPAGLAETDFCRGIANRYGHDVSDWIVATDFECDAVQCGCRVLIEIDLEHAVFRSHDGGGRHVHERARHVVDTAVVVGAVALEIRFVAGGGTNGESRP